MNPIDFPNKDQYYLTLAEEAFLAGNFKQALENYQLAYRDSPSPKLNRLIVSLLLEQGELSAALEYAEEEIESYLETPETIDLFLQVQLYSHHFFAAREFLWRVQKNSHVTKEQQNLWQMRIDDQEEFYQKQQRLVMQEIEIELDKLPQLPPMEQLSKVRDIQLLSNERLKKRAEDFMLDPAVTPLARSYLFESLARIGTANKVRYLTIQDEVVELSPADSGFDDSLQQAIEEGLNQRLADNDPILLVNLLEQIKLEMAFLYPLQSSFMNPAAWIASYLAEYSGRAEVLDEQVEMIRNRIKQLMLGYN